MNGKVFSIIQARNILAFMRRQAQEEGRWGKQNDAKTDKKAHSGHSHSPTDALHPGVWWCVVWCTQAWCGVVWYTQVCGVMVVLCGARRCGGIILHEFTHNQSAQSSDTTLEAPFKRWGRRINIQQWVAVAQDSLLFTPEKRFYSYLANQSSVLLQSI